MATTKVSKFVLEDNTVTFEKLAIAEGAAGQVISVDENNQLLLTDRFTQEEIEDITAALLLRGNHTNLSISYIGSSNQLDIVAHGAVRSVNGEIGDVVLTTDNISEGTENLYFTNARADARIAVANIGDLNNVDTTGISTGDFLLYDGNNFLPVAFEEEVNTYADTRISLANVQDLANVDGSDTLNPGDILFYDDGDSEFKFINLGDEINSYFDIRFATKNTGHLAEGSNLYYTDARVDARVDIAITNLVNGADAAFDTLKEIQDAMATDTELADAINALVIPSDLSDLTDTSSLLFSRDYNDLTNKPNLFSGSYNDLTDVPALVVSYNDLTDLPTLFSGSYNDLTDKPNLVVSYNDLTDVPSEFFDVDSITTDDLIEGTENLYFTDARARNAVQTAVTNSFGTTTTNTTDGVEVAIDALSVGTGTPILVSNTTTTTTTIGETVVTTTAGEVFDAQDITDDLIDTTEITVLTIKDPTEAIQNPFGDGNVGNVGQVSSTYNTVSSYNTINSHNGLSADIAGEYSVNDVIALERGNNEYSFFKKTSTGWLSLAELGVDTLNNEIDTFADKWAKNNSDTVSLSSISTNDGLFWLKKSTDTTDFEIVEYISTFDFDFTTATATERVTDTTVIETDDSRLRIKSIASSDTITVSETNGTISLSVSPEYALKSELFSGSYNDLTDVPALVVSYNDLTDTPTIPSVAGLASETYVNIAISNLVNGADAAFDTLKEIQDAMSTDTELASAINNLVIPEDVSDLTDSTNLFFSGSYNDLTDVPALVVSYNELTDLPTNVSAFNNDAGYLTDDTMLTDYGLITDSSVYGNGSNISSSITNVSSLNNDAGYISSTNTPVSTFQNDAGYLSSVSINDLTDVNISNVSLTDNQYLRWNGTDAWINETINIPTKVSDLINDTGFLTSQTVGGNYMVTDADNTVSGSQFPSADNTYDLGSDTKQWRTIYGHEVEATYADLAERYASDAPYEPGTVVVFGGEAEITTTTLDTDVSIAGVISTNPALKLNSSAGNNQTHPYIALKGRVPCKVIGPVRKGELLVSSSTPGYARSCGKLDMGLAVFAKALENDLSEGEKIIEVAVI